MKTLKNTQTDIPKQEGDGNATFAELAMSALNQAPAQGFSPDEMRIRMRVLDVLQKGGETIELEDAHAAKLIEAASQVQWKFMHKDLVAFHDAVDELKF